VLATDLEGDSLDDLLCASATLDTLAVFRNSGPSARAPVGVVDPLTFTQTGEAMLSPGRPLQMQLVDVDGDRIHDVVVHVVDRAAPTRHAIHVFVADGVGRIARSFLVPDRQVGSGGVSAGLHVDVGDLNGDGLRDLLLGFSGDAVGQQSYLRVLFGNHR
jgi:hypothetical protein